MSTDQVERIITEVYPNGSIAITRIRRCAKPRCGRVNEVIYEVYRVGQRGWATIVPITNSNLNLRQYTAREQDRIAQGN